MPNQHKPTPPLDELAPHILRYWKTRLNDKEIIQALQKHFNTERYGIGLTKFHQIRVDMGLERSCQQGHTIETIHEAVTDLRKMYPHAGTREMISLLFHEKSMSVSRSVMMSYFAAYEPELRFWAAGVNDLFAVDQHDKWLRFGLGLHTGIELFSGWIMWIRVWHSNRNPQLKKNVMPEITWSPLRRRFTPGFENLLDEGVIEGWYDSADTLQMMIFRWVFIPWLQQELDAYRDRVNNSAKRRDRNKVLPHGVPTLIYHSPEDFGALDFKVSIDHEGIDYVRNVYIDASNPVFDLVPPMLGNFIEHCYDAMGRPAVTRSSVWTVYRNVLSAVQLAENPHPNLLLTRTENEGAATGALTLISGHADLPFNEEPDDMYYMGGVRGGLGLGDSHVHNLNALAELDEPDVPLDGSSAGVGPLIVWQFSSDESENDGAVDEW
ncbi:uncharacterized protein EDB93DRAFT_1249488 [Suillus bovinus]|uniref:uncharacterized protein n=1 Tax=Suillus bovinus TaxID=48563 RepID=UPI001B880C06|nr:uncharacterized protein EDB93DRAFT_1249488 [Suillus bovinus]KAG2150988.1 hypothetical protein EDB93DRAFT_1249488 [Suillus bovinus]